MPVTLAQAKVGMADKVDQQVIDELRRNSILLDGMVFDDCVSPGTGGSTLTYGYITLETAATAAKRELNNEYNAQEATKKKNTVDLAILGGSFKVDRVIANTSGAVDEINFQLQQKIKSTVAVFNNLLINGQKGTDGFDGLKTLLTSKNTEIDGSKVDVSGAMTENTAEALMELIDSAIAEMDGKPSYIIANHKAIVKLKAAARKAGYITRAEDAFGRTSEGYDGIPFIDAGDYNNAGTATSVIPVDPTSGKTDIYLVRTAIDGLHGVTVNGDKMLKTYLPDMNLPGAVKEGEVEFIVAPVLKSSRAAARIKDVKIAVGSE